MSKWIDMTKCCLKRTLDPICQLSFVFVLASSLEAVTIKTSVAFNGRYPAFLCIYSRAVQVRPLSGVISHSGRSVGPPSLSHAV